MSLIETREKSPTTGAGGRGHGAPPMIRVPSNN